MNALTLQNVSRTADFLLRFFAREFRSLDPTEFRFKMHNIKKGKLIDISTSEEYHELHIPGSINYDILSPDFINEHDKLDKTRTYFIYCRNGKRSERALQLMQELGFKRVYSLMSGLQAWQGTVERSY